MLEADAHLKSWASRIKKIGGQKFFADKIRMDKHYLNRLINNQNKGLTMKTYKKIEEALQRLESKHNDI